MKLLKKVLDLCALGTIVIVCVFIFVSYKEQVHWQIELGYGFSNEPSAKAINIQSSIITETSSSTSNVSSSNTNTSAISNESSYVNETAAATSTGSIESGVGPPTPGKEGWGRRALLRSCYTYENLTATNICCRMHAYTPTDLHRCAKSVVTLGGPVISSRFNIVLIGDSRTRQLFVSLAHLLRDTNMTYSILEPNGKSGNIKEILPRLFNRAITNKNIRLLTKDTLLNITFYWDPYLDNSLPKLWDPLLENRLPKLLEQWLAHPETRPHLLQIGSGLHYLAYSRTHRQRPPFKLFVQRWNDLLPSLSALANTTHTIVKMVDHVLVKYAQDRVTWRELTDENIDNLNSMLSSLLIQSGPNKILQMNGSMAMAEQYVERCYKTNMSTPDFMWTCNDPIHLGYKVMHQIRDMMLNSFCNKYLQLGNDYCT